MISHRVFTAIFVVVIVICLVGCVTEPSVGWMRLDSDIVYDSRWLRLVFSHDVAPIFRPYLFAPLEKAVTTTARAL